MTGLPDPVASQVTDLNRRRDLLVKEFGVYASFLIDYCLDQLTVEKIAEYRSVDVSTVELQTRHKLESGGRGSSGHAFLRELGREDPRRCLDELALLLSGMQVCGNCRNCFKRNQKGRAPHYCGSKCRQAAWRQRRNTPGYLPVEARPLEPEPVDEGRIFDVAWILNYSLPRAMAYVARRERGEHPALAGVQARRHRRACRPFRIWESDGRVPRITIGRLYDWAFLEAVVRRRDRSSRAHEFYELTGYEHAESFAANIRIHEPAAWRELDLFPL